MNRRHLLSSVLGALATGAGVGAQGGYVSGIFVHTTGGPVELIAYADRTGIGLMRMSFGSLEDVPALASPARVLCNLPHWKPTQVWVSTRRSFKDEFAERRNVPFAVRPLTISALEIRLADFENPDRIDRLLKSVRASDANPAYLFITLDNGSATRDYMIEILRER